jgi:hypothetical protein
MADFTALVPPKFNGTLGDYDTHTPYLEKLGIDPEGVDDTVFGTEIVYCASHLRPHSTGWCTVDNVQKVPLVATEPAEAIKEARQLGFTIYGDKL